MVAEKLAIKTLTKYVATGASVFWVALLFHPACRALNAFVYSRSGGQVGMGDGMLMLAAITMLSMLAVLGVCVVVEQIIMRPAK